MGKKKYSYNERVDYHKKKYSNFVDKFRKGNSLDFRKLEVAENKSSKMSYSSGYCDFASGISRGYIMSESELKQHNASFQKGFSTAKKAWEKSRNVKF